MERRDVLKGLSLAGTLAMGPMAPAIAAIRDPGEFRRLPQKLDAASAVVPLIQLENDYLSVVLLADASARIVDRKNHCEWRMGSVAAQEESEIDIGDVWVRTERSICEQYPGRFRGQREGDNLRIWLLGREDAVRGSFLIHVALDGPWLEFRVVWADDHLPGLTFPPPIESESLVIPMNAGRWIRKPLRERLFYTFFSQLNMRWFGGLKEDRGWLAVFPEENFVDSGIMLTEMSVAPAWLKQLGKWEGPRSIRYRFVAGNYVDLAMEYRQWAMQKGLHRSLTAKLVETPALANLTQGRIISIVEAEPRHEKRYDEDIFHSGEHDPLLGTGPHVLFTHAQAQECIQRLHEAALERALVVVRGWIPGGYDYSHPDVWPPEPQLGSIAELERLCNAPDGYSVALHDNYQDIYRQSPSWPGGIIQRRNGDRMPGGYWAGGQAYIVNARDGVKHARRNWQSVNQLQPKAYFIDTTSAVQPYQSYESGNTLTRVQDVANKVELMRFFKSNGLALGSEGGADFAVPWLDWNENRHTRTAGESVPLWSLVFHDAVVSARYRPGDLPMEAPNSLNDGPPRWLEDMLWGYALLTDVKDYTRVQAAVSNIVQTQHVDAWFRSISTAAMVNHRFLTTDASLEETSFSNGFRIIVNFAAEPQVRDGDAIPAFGYRIRTGAALDHKTSGP
jgi:hypothetical protein